MEPTKQINIGTIAGDKKAAVRGGFGCDLFIRSGIFDEDDLDFDFIKEQEELFFGKGTGAGVKACFAKKKRKEPALPCESCNGKWHRHKRSGVDVGDGEEKGRNNKRKRHREGKKKNVYSTKGKDTEKQKEKTPSGGDQDVEPCEICNGCHKICPLLFELPRGPAPVINPGWYFACMCCYGKKFEEKTSDCARCGSSKKVVLQKICLLCERSGHFDNKDKDCDFFGKDVPGYPFSQPYFAKLFAKKQEELAAVEYDQ